MNAALTIATTVATAAPTMIASSMNQDLPPTRSGMTYVGPKMTATELLMLREDAMRRAPGPAREKRMSEAERLAAEYDRMFRESLQQQRSRR